VHNWVLFDWGDTLMRTFDYPGPMCSWPRVETLPGALSALRSLEGRAGLALATNAADSEEQEIRKALTMVGLDAYLPRVFCYRSVGHKKSSPPFFTHVMEQLRVAPQALVMVGDDFAQDVTAANAMGIKGVWLNARSQETRSGENFRTIHDLTELPRTLEQWGFLASGTT
jgi:HAD superfamily hydrolase (TIGR01509 family)